MMVIRAGIHKMLVRIANREDPDQTASQSDLHLGCLSMPIWQASSVQNFKIFTVHVIFMRKSLYVICINLGADQISLCNLQCFLKSCDLMDYFISNHLCIISLVTSHLFQYVHSPLWG